MSNEIFTHQISRRSLLQTASIATGCRLVAMSGLATISGLGLSPAQAIEPIKRNGSPKFKFSVAAYSYRSLLQDNRKPKNEKATLTIHDFIDECAKWGCEGTELTSYYFPEKVSVEELTATRQHCFRLGLEVSGTSVGNDFCIPAGKARDAQITNTKQWIDNASILGAPVIRIFSGRVQKGQNPKEAHKLIVSGIEECCDYAGKHGVHLALENHGGPTVTPKGLLEIVKDVKSQW
jgi:sugar phosphate isomerase/epimerase